MNICETLEKNLRLTKAEHKMEVAGKQEHNNDIKKNDMDILTFKTIRSGSFKLARKFATEPILSRLCAVQKKLVVVDTHGDEYVPEVSTNTYPEFVTNEVYTVCDELDLEDSEDEENFQQLPLEKQDHLFKKLATVAVDMEHARKSVINDLYKHLHPNLLKFNPQQHLLPSFYEAMKTKNFDSILKQETKTKIYSLYVFNDDFCKQLLEEVESFENSGLPVMRPNSMNNYGLILDEIGFTKFFDDFVEFILPLTTHLYSPLGSKLDSHHAFIVQYKMTEDKDLDFHYDASEITLNVCLGKKFTGGSLYFRGLLEDPSTHDEDFEFNHKPGLACLHFGKHRHGANSITSGERYNLILWMRHKNMHDSCDHCGGVH